MSKVTPYAHVWRYLRYYCATLACRLPTSKYRYSCICLIAFLQFFFLTIESHISISETLITLRPLIWNGLKFNGVSCQIFLNTISKQLQLLKGERLVKFLSQNDEIFVVTTNYWSTVVEPLIESIYLVAGCYFEPDGVLIYEFLICEL